MVKGGATSATVSRAWTQPQPRFGVHGVKTAFAGLESSLEQVVSGLWGGGWWPHRHLASCERGVC